MVNAACLVAIVLATGSIGFSAQGASQNLSGFRKHFVGLPAGNFTLRNLKGKKVSLSEFRGKTVVLSFWATWCLPCKAELPVIQKIYAQDRDKNVVVLTVDDESRVTIRDFLKKHHYDFMALVDHKRALFKEFAVHFIPAVFVINDEGIIVRHIVGWHGPQPILAAVKAGEQ